MPRPTPVTGAPDHRFKHMYVLGRSGFGKSTFLRNCLLQDAYNEHGIIFMSTDGSVFHEDIMPFLPQERVDDVIYIDPSDEQPPFICFNPFALREGENLNRKVDEVSAVFERAIKGEMGVKMKPMWKAACFALTQRKESTLVDIRELLDPDSHVLRQEMLSLPNLEPETRLFLQKYNRDKSFAAKYYQAGYMPVVNRLTDFYRDPLKTFISHSSFSFADILNKKAHIILVNLSNLGPDSRKLFAQVFLSLVQFTIFERRENDPTNVPVYLIIDEFQDYAEANAEAIGILFQKARKRAMGVTLATPTANSQEIPKGLNSTIIGSGANIVCFQQSAEDARYFVSELQLRDEKFQLRTEWLQNLKVGEAYIRTSDMTAGIKIRIPRDLRELGLTITAPQSPTYPYHLIGMSKQNFGYLPASAKKPFQAEPPPSYTYNGGNAEEQPTIHEEHAPSNDPEAALDHPWMK